jgi:hypothetical protein
MKPRLDRLDGMQMVPVTVVAVSRAGDGTKLITNLPINEFDWKDGVVFSVVPGSPIALGPVSFQFVIANGYWKTFEDSPDDPEAVAVIPLDERSIGLLNGFREP